MMVCANHCIKIFIDSAWLLSSPKLYTLRNNKFGSSIFLTELKILSIVLYVTFMNHQSSGDLTFSFVLITIHKSRFGTMNKAITFILANTMKNIKYCMGVNS